MLTMVAEDNLIRKTFDSFDEGCSFIDQFFSDGFHLCKRASRTTIAQFNRKIRAADQRIMDRLDDAVYSTR